MHRLIVATPAHWHAKPRGVSRTQLPLGRLQTAVSRAMATIGLHLPRELLLVRHGESEANVAAARLFKGDDSGKRALLDARRHDSDARLTEKGRQQARAVGAWAREHAGPLDRYISSSYVRARETAGEMRLDDARWELDMMLREREQGLNQGHGSPLVGISREELDRHDMSNMYWAPVAGESIADVCLRVRQFLQSLPAAAEEQRMVIVCHMRVLQAFQVLLEDIPQSEYPELCNSHLPNCAVLWYSRVDAAGVLHDTMCSRRVVVVDLEGRCQREETVAVGRRFFSNEDLLAQVRLVRQVVHSSPCDGGEGGEDAGTAAPPGETLRSKV